MIKLGLIGSDITHSLSSAVHTCVMDKLGIEGEYTHYTVEKGGLPAFMESVKAGEINGFNVTMPHKTDIIPYLDFMDEESISYNAVNTVNIVNGKLHGYNTDAVGFVLSLEEQGVEVEGKNIIILGTGGSASSLALKFARLNAKSVDMVSARDIPSELPSCDILVNATPLGMQGKAADFTDFGFLDSLHNAAVVCDLIYAPPKTTLLKEAEARGLKIINGLGMLIYQALISDEIYLNTKIDLHEMKNYVMYNLSVFS